MQPATATPAPTTSVTPSQTATPPATPEAGQPAATPATTPVAKKAPEIKTLDIATPAADETKQKPLRPEHRPHAFVIMPQALRRLLPPLVGLLVNIIQNTTIVQVIGAPELLETAERQVERLTIQPSPRLPTMFLAGTRTLSKKTSLKSASPVICRRGRTVMPGVSMSIRR